jgi:hypothetical protein
MQALIGYSIRPSTTLITSMSLETAKTNLGNYIVD